MDPTIITAERILAVPKSDPEQLFSAPDVAQAEYRLMAKRFHPDQGGSAQVFAHLSVLYAAAREKIANGSWRTPGVFEATGVDGKIRRIRYVKDFEFGLGRAYIASSFVAYDISRSFSDLTEAAVKLMSFRYPIAINNAIRSEMVLRLPIIHARFATVSANVTVIHKDKDVLRLRDVFDHLGGRLDPRHVAWIVSDLLNIACYLEWAKLTHNDLSMDTIFICPAMHRAVLLGGWWHAVPAGERMARLQTGRTMAYMPRSVMSSKVASFATDLELIRLTARELLGDAVGSRLDAPAPLALWLRTATSGNARRDYREWQDVLTASFGARRFVKLDIDPSAIYSTGA